MLKRMFVEIVTALYVMSFFIPGTVEINFLKIFNSLKIFNFFKILTSNYLRQ